MNQTNSSVATKNASWKLGDAIQTMTVVMDQMKQTAQPIHRDHFAHIINLPAIRTTNAFQEATTVIWKEIVKMGLMKLVAVSIFLL